MNQNKKKVSGFLVFYIIFVLLIVGFWVYFLNGVILKDVKIYEASQAKYYMEDIIARLQSGDVSQIDFASSSSRFEDPDYYKNTFISLISGKTLSCEESPTSYDTQAPIFDVYAGMEKVATVNLKSTSSTQLMFILSVQEWAVESIEPTFEVTTSDITISVPDTYSVVVNGQASDDRELVSAGEEYDEFEIVSKYVDVPKKNSYLVSGLMTTPTVSIYDQDGAMVEAKVEGNAYSVGFEGVDVPTDISVNAITNAKAISAVYAGDMTLAAIKKFLPDDSYLIPLFESYIAHDSWMYSGHTEPQYSEEWTSNYIRYNDNLYSVVVHFDKTMYLPKRSMTVTVPVYNTYYYANIGGSWKIVDMISMSEDE